MGSHGTYPFADPLGATDAAGTRRRIRHALALIHGAGAVSLVMALPEIDGPLAQHLADVGAAGHRQTTADALLHAADAALYRAKRAGRDAVCAA